jgi:hypothetical protein
MDNQPDSQPGCESIPELDHFLELVGCVDVQEGERNGARVKRFLSQAHHYGRILANAVKHHRTLEFGSNLADDVNAFRFKRLQVADSPSHD